VDFSSLVRQIPDFPKPGILFYDITTLLADPDGLHALIDSIGSHYEGMDVDLVVGMEARGFILAPMLAYRLKAGFIPVRKPNKLPGATASVAYELEYGSDELHVHLDAIKPGMRVLICDDLLATGGTAAATVQLVRDQGGVVLGCAFAIELTFLEGRSRLQEVDVFSAISYDS
jgi:adenine phosphoribosyltransferase